MDLDLIDQACGEVLLRDVRAASERDVLSACGPPGLFERGLAAVASWRAAQGVGGPAGKSASLCGAAAA